MKGLIAVTGASGYLGCRLTAILLREGYHVRAIHRKTSTPENLLPFACDSLEIVRADLEFPPEALTALRNVDAVIHAAALARDWGTSSAFTKANVALTRTLVDAAKSAGCVQFIFVSSLAVHGFGFHGNSTEEGPYYPISNPYPASKKVAETIALERSASGFSVSVLRLGYIFGPADTTSTYRMFNAARKGAFGWIGRGDNRTSMVYVDDACQALVRAVGKDEIRGEILNIIGDETITWKDFAILVYKVLGLHGKPRRLPKALALLVASVLSVVYTILGSKDGPSLTPYRVRRSTVEYVFSNAKAKRLLGFVPRFGIEEGLKIAAAEYLSEKP